MTRGSIPNEDESQIPLQALNPRLDIKIMEKDIAKDLCDVRANESVSHQYIATCIASLSTFCYGCALGWVSPSIALLQSSTSPVQPPLNLPQTAALASLYCAGALVGTLLFGLMAQRMGRRLAGLATALPYIICWVLKLWTASFAGLIIARTIAGLSGGGSLLLAPQYCVEIGTNRLRGALASIAILAMNGGLVFAYTIGAFLPYRAVLWVHLMVPIVYLIAYYFMPETPIFLVKQRKYLEALKSISWLRNIPQDDTISQNALALLKEEALLESTTGKATFKEIVTSHVTLKAFATCFVLIGIQGYVGIYAILSFASEIFQAAGSSLSPNVSAIVLSSLQFIGAYASTLLVERVGRKVLFITSSSVFGLALFVMGTYFYFQSHGQDVSTLGWIPLIALCTGVCIDATGVGPVPFIVINEVFTVQARGLATTILIFWMWVTQLTQSQFYSDIVNVIGSDGIFWGFSIIAFSGSFFCYFFIPETKGKNQEEILKFFEKKKPLQSKRKEDFI